MEAFWNSFNWESSDLDWCEPNFVVTPNIAEFFNTISNLPFIIIPPLLVYLFLQYGRLVTRGCHLVWFLLWATGVFSAYFHATLSLAGQLLDEFAILWVFNAALTIWVPKHLLPVVIQNNMNQLQTGMVLITILGTVLGCVYPVINALILITFGLPTAFILVSEIRRLQLRQVTRLGTRVLVMWVVAVTLWVSDRVVCNMWLQLGLPYGHSIWHVLIFFVGCQACVLFAFMDSVSQFPDTNPVIAYWPSNDFEWLGIPYVDFQVLPTTIKSKPPSFGR